MKVFGARCIVKEEKQGEETVSGIIIPGKDKEPTYVGRIIAVGDGALLENGERVSMQVKEGDRIAYTTFSGSPIKNGEDEFIILNERDILCVLED
jgi:chaperonin GroES